MMVGKKPPLIFKLIHDRAIILELFEDRILVVTVMMLLSLLREVDAKPSVTLNAKEFIVVIAKDLTFCEYLVERS